MVTVSFRVATAEDAAAVNADLRAEDRREIAALGLAGKDVVDLCRIASDYAWTGLIDGVPAMIFGCTQSPLKDTGEVWALGTPALDGLPRQVLVWGRKQLAAMLDIFDQLENFVFAENVRSLRWLRSLGFEISDPEPYGVKGEKFCHIVARRSETCV